MRARERAVDKITNLREKKKETAKRFLDDIYSGSDGDRSLVAQGGASSVGDVPECTSPFMKLKYAREKKKRKKEDTSNSDFISLDSDHLKLPPPMKIPHSSCNSKSKSSKQKMSFIEGLSANNDKSAKIVLENDDKTLDKKLVEDGCRRDSPKTERGKGSGRSREMEDSLILPEPDTSSVQSRKSGQHRRMPFLYGGGWPSESDDSSDDTSDENDCTPLREILNTTQERVKNVSECKKDRAHTCGGAHASKGKERREKGKYRHVEAQKKTPEERKSSKPSKVDSQEGASCLSHFGQYDLPKPSLGKIQENTNTYPCLDCTTFYSTNNSNVERKNTNNKNEGSKPPEPVAKSRQEETTDIGRSQTADCSSQQHRNSVISISSDDSIGNLDLLMSDDFSPVQDPVTSTRSFLHPSATRVSPVAKSLRRGRHMTNNSRHVTNLHAGERDMATGTSIVNFQGVDVVQSPLVSSSGLSARADKSRQAVPLSSATVRVPGLKRSRTTASKGHSSRGTSSVQGHGSFMPASTLMSPRGGRRDSDVVRVVEQVEADEEIARRLQEEMDMEFAMTLHEMENEPPQTFGETRVDVPNHGGTRDVPHPAFVERILYPSRHRDRAGIDDAVMSTDSEDSLPFEHLFPTTASPSRRPRTRSSRSSRAARFHSHEAVLGMLAGVDNLMPWFRDMDDVGRRRGRRGSRIRFDLHTGEAAEGNDYEDLLNLAEVLGEVKKRGLTANQASRLPERKFESASNPDDNTECMICMSEYQSDDNLRILPCFHEFHSLCIDKWIKNNATCPICRVEVKV